MHMPMPMDVDQVKHTLSDEERAAAEELAASAAAQAEVEAEFIEAGLPPRKKHAKRRDPVTMRLRVFVAQRLAEVCVCMCIARQPARAS